MAIHIRRNGSLLFGVYVLQIYSQRQTLIWSGSGNKKGNKTAWFHRMCSVISADPIYDLHISLCQYHFINYITVVTRLVYLNRVYI
jgi:hypothetical protein